MIHTYNYKIIYSFLIIMGWPYRKYFIEKKCISNLQDIINSQMLNICLKWLSFNLREVKWLHYFLQNLNRNEEANVDFKLDTRIKISLRISLRINSRSLWWTGRPGMLWFMGSWRVGHDWVTELNWVWRQDQKLLKVLYSKARLEGK